MKQTWESVLILTAAAVLVIVVVWVMRLKTRGLMRLAINSLAGGALIAGLCAFDIIALPLNAFNAMLIGILGLPGAGLVIAATFLL